MGASLKNTTTTDFYKDTVLGGGSLYANGSLTIANNPVSVLLTTGDEFGQTRDTEYPFVTPTTTPILGGVALAQGEKAERIVSVALKSAIPGTPAQVSGWLVEPTRAGLGVGQPFSGTVSPSGGVTPGAQSVQIQKNGVLVGTEPILDFEDGGGQVWTASDDVPGTRVKVGLTGGANIVTTPANPGGLLSGSFLMEGFGSTWKLTPRRSGVVFIFAQGITPATVATAAMQLNYGTGAAPVNGAAVTGIQATIGIIVPQNSTAAMGVAVGLAVGTAYWFDVAIAGDGVHAMFLNNVTLSAVEL